MNIDSIMQSVVAYHLASSSNLHLIPSENQMSIIARLPYLSELAHRYCFSSDVGENWSWPGNASIAEIENEAMFDIQNMFGAKYINIKPISGINCMAIAMSAFSEPNSTIFSIGIDDGGHGSTTFLANKMALKQVDIPFDKSNFCIDIEGLSSQIKKTKGKKIIYLDQFMCLFPHDLAALKSVIEEDTIIHYDGSHVMGLIAGGQFQHPLAEGADCFGGSTHKSFPGPNKGILLTNSKTNAELINLHASKWVSQHHPASVVALSITLKELQEKNKIKYYAERTVRNASYLANKLANLGFEICGEAKGFTKSHQIWIDIDPLIEATEANKLLMSAGIVANAIPIPYLSSKNGLRLGVQEVSWLGMERNEMDEISNFFYRLLFRKENPESIKKEVTELTTKFKMQANSASDAIFKKLFNIP